MEKQTEQKTKEKIKVTDIDIVVTDRFPSCYEIKYKKAGENEYITGFGSYNFEKVIRCRDELFEIVKEQKEEEQKEEEHVVTNEELLKHLKELEIAQSCVLNGINCLFNIIDSKSELLQFDDKQKRNLEMAMIVTACVTEDMIEVSGLKEESEKLREQKEKLMQEFLKDFFE